jgi:hypothetical protein
MFILIIHIYYQQVTKLPVKFKTPFSQGSGSLFLSGSTILVGNFTDVQTSTKLSFGTTFTIPVIQF